jgi:hypothetical protein
MKFLKFILPVLVIFQIAVFAQSFKKSNVLTFAETNCKTIGRNPLVTVCIESATQDAKFTKRLGGAFKSAIDELVGNYQNESSLLKLITTPSFYGVDDDDCPYGCDSPYTWNPCCGAPTYCDAVPNDPIHCKRKKLGSVNLNI